jgi:competence protein ComEA
LQVSLPLLSGVRSGDGGGGEELLRRRGAAEAGPRTWFTSLHAVIVILLLACALCASLTMLVRQSMNYHAMHGQGVGSGQRATESRGTGEGAGSKASADSVGTGAHADTGAGADAPPGETAQPSVTPSPTPSETSAPSDGSASTAAPGSGALDLNAASAQDLEAIAHIGPVTAQRILDHRRSIGRFSSVDQLLDVKGIGVKTLEKIRPHLRVS